MTKKIIAFKYNKYKQRSQIFQQYYKDSEPAAFVFRSKLRVQKYFRSSLS